MRTRFLLIVAFWFFYLPNSFGQYEHTYDSLYQPLPGYSGRATFKYHTGVDGKHVKDGQFVFNSKKVDSSGGMNVRNMVWKGDYSKNLKENDWEYVTVSNKLKLIDINEDFEVAYELYSEKEKLKAQYKYGKPSGKWRLEREILKDSKAVKLISAIRGNMDQSKFYGSVEIFGLDEQDQPYTIEAEVEEGLLIEQCMIQYVEGNRQIEEIRLYDQGFLLKLVKTDRQTGDTLVDLNLPLSQQIHSFLRGEGDEKAAGRPLSLHYSDGYPRSSTYIREQKSANKLIELSLKDLFKFEKDYFESNGLPLGTNRLHYPLQAKEKEVLKEWPNVEFKFRDKVTALEELKDANFKYNKNDTLNMIDAWVDRQSYLLSYIKTWNQIIAHDEIIYFNREGQLYNYAIDLLKEDTLKAGDSYSIVNYELKNDIDSSFLFYVVSNFESRIHVADSMSANYQRIVKQLNLADEILQQEWQINTLKKHLDSMYSGIPETRQKAELMGKIKERFLTSKFEKKNQEFIQFKGPKEMHKAKGDSLVFDLRLLKDTYYTIEEIFYTAANIDTLYTEYVFDAYTFNDRFPKRIKKKLYQSGAEDLFEELLKLASEQPSPVEMRATLNRVRSLQERMIFLADKNTSKLERKLRTKLTMEKKFELMKID